MSRSPAKSGKAMAMKSLKEKWLSIVQSVKDASLTRVYSFLPASWAGDTHEETNILPIGNQEEKGKRFLNHRTDSLEMMQVLGAKHLADKGPYRGWRRTRGSDC